MLPRSLYVHVPFCVRRCAYCDFAVEAMRDAPTADWLRAIAKEWDLTAREMGWAGPLSLDTVYVGGGTPSLLDAGAMSALAETVRRHATWHPASVEWTCEANPESFSAEIARDWKAAGINRISLGAQSFDERVLRWMGRLHGAEGPGRAVATAREAGFDNVSIDLIFGVPGRLERDWEADLERTLALAPEHVSLYGLTAEIATPLGRWVRDGRETLADEDRYADEYLLAHRRLTDAGYEHYEVSNFGLPGRRSRHNFAYWTGVPYAALGPGSHAYYPPVRRWNARGWHEYEEALRDSRSPVDGEERISVEDAALERVWLALRTDLGFPVAEATPVQLDLARLWEGAGWAQTAEDRVRLTAEGWLLLDRLALDFAAAGEARHELTGFASRPAPD
ncbi:MAG: radical SAM family heme chaperone HemW [Gemmatimonadetes bacterium]|nr:radical SAM family heme chaperone HemW [Gemmatimonadota bacterium]